jgi:hypothetical protein
VSEVQRSPPAGRHRRRTREVLLALPVLFLFLPVAWLASRRPEARHEASYRGKTTSQWAAALQQWDVGGEVASNKFGHQTLWRRNPSIFQDWSERLGFVARDSEESLPLLEGDLEAVPVLIALLADADPKVRRVAVQGLEWVGERAKAAVPALLEALDDPDEWVRRDAEQALFRVDREAAEKAGLEWTIFGLGRREPRTPPDEP